MSVAASAWTAIKNRITAEQVAGGKLEFMKNLYEGFRSPMPTNVMPAAVMEPVGEAEDMKTPPMPLGVKVLAHFTVTCLVMHSKTDKAIVGDADNTGIIDFVAAMKNTIQGTDMTLGLKGPTKVRFPQTTYHYDAWPIRAAEILVEVESLVTTTTR